MPKRKTNSKKDAKINKKTSNTYLRSRKRYYQPKATSTTSNSFYKKNKVTILVASIASGLLILLFIITAISRSITKAIELKKSFYLDVPKNFSFDCNAKHSSSSNSSSYCEKREITGKFSNYDSVYLTTAYYSYYNYGYNDSSFSINGDDFSKTINYQISNSLWETNDFNYESLPNELTQEYRIVLYNSTLKKEVASETVSVRFTLTEPDKELIAQNHSAWVAKKAEEDAKKAEEEARKQAEKEEAERKAAEEAARQQAEEEARKQAELEKRSMPSIDTISDACWSYGRAHGVHLTDYASTNISKDGDYYKILMWEKGGKSVWNCWYNPNNKDVFIEINSRL